MGNRRSDIDVVEDNVTFRLFLSGRDFDEKRQGVSNASTCTMLDRKRFERIVPVVVYPALVAGNLLTQCRECSAG